MSLKQEIAVIVVVSIMVAIGIVLAVCAALKLWKLKAEAQEELVNIYTPEILGSGEKEEEIDDDDDDKKEKVEKPEADAEKAVFSTDGG